MIIDVKFLLKVAGGILLIAIAVKGIMENSKEHDKVNGKSSGKSTGSSSDNNTTAS